MKLRILKDPHRVRIATVVGGQQVFVDCGGCGELEPVIHGILTTDEGLDPQYLCERCTESRMTNRYLKPGSRPFAALPDGTPLYPAYYPLRPGESFRRGMRLWNGAVGEWVGVTLDGELYRQSQYWGGESPRPGKWQKFKLGGA
jgi:hypothetical protein